MLFKDFTREINPHQAYRIKKLKQQLAQAENYTEWKNIALKIDEESGAQEWKYDNCSPYFDAEVITHRLGLLKRYRQQKRTTDLMYLLREGLSYDIANIAHPMLFTATYVGTKKIIEDYIDEVSLGLAFVASTDCQCLDKQQKIEFEDIWEKAVLPYREIWNEEKQKYLKGEKITGIIKYFYPHGAILALDSMLGCADIDDCNRKPLYPGYKISGIVSGFDEENSRCRGKQ